MENESIAAIFAALEKAQADLRDMSLIVEREIAKVASAFESLANNADSILSLTAAIVVCVEDENISSVLPKVQSLGTAARHFISERLQATTGILETVATEMNLLRELAVLTRGQRTIALETQALSVLTNIEAARLGAVGDEFQFLARELADFSKTLTIDTQELARQTDARRAAIEETKGVLAAELPALREKMARTGAELSSDLVTLDARLSQLTSTPTRFKTSVEHSAQQIAGVVAAVQAHDITHQQIQHVLEAFALIASEVGTDADAHNGDDRELPRAYAGLTIQIYQLKTIRNTVATWTSQINDCMDGILRVSTSEVMGIAPQVLEQEREVAEQLAHIELLERESQSYGMKIQRTLGGLSNLMQLVSEHKRKSQSARECLELLGFNSIIQASRLGAQAGAILAIAKCIKKLSADWSDITNKSGHVMTDIQNLVKRTNKVMEAFSEGSNKMLLDAQAETTAGLGNLRNAAEFAATQAQKMNLVTGKMQEKSGEVGETTLLLDSCFGRIDSILVEIEGIRRQLEIEHPGLKNQYDTVDVEKLFSTSYTTEVERDVLHAALRGAALPLAQQTFAGNSAELF